MAEEHKCQTPEGHRLCVNNCGFFGSPATMNLCSKCYRDFRLKEHQGAASIKSSLLPPLVFVNGCRIRFSGSTIHCPRSHRRVACSDCRISWQLSSGRSNSNQIGAWFAGNGSG
ncbi:Zinc finger A20 and AN1 domain-containing stress-associated protein 4 [Hibiscus syriacus]|uniref:Zinc finger A20 and AN1 domain-containing stress-associated protein 4 n=1 Tax=Hibiscus syriacus TaxID=106335 RepID=A0A6A2XW78_HIBSY|nr:Zinc finger A20 and AN1 domain-containing stress-associated protein 4 [Hibiscus syriacus]